MKKTTDALPLDYGRWLRHGRGLAILRAGEVPRAERHDALLDACTHFTGYDSRPEYLFDALVAAGARDALEAPILAALEHREHWDRVQLLGLALLFALDGSAPAERALMDTFVRCVSEPERPGAEQVVRAYGLPGVLLVARELGRVLADEGAGWEEVHPLDVAEEQLGAEVVTSALAQAATEDAHVRRYHDAVREYREEHAGPRSAQRSPLPFPPTFEGLRAAVLEAGASAVRVWARRWGREAPVEELTRATEGLRSGAPPELVLALLRAFDARSFPAPADLLLELVRSGEEALVEAAWNALGHVRSEEVRAYARAELAKPQPNLDALRGLQQDFRGDDVPLVSSVVSGISDPEAFHSVGLVLLAVLEASGGPHLAPLLLQLYEGGNCGMCRHSHVEWMRKLGVAPQSVLVECRYDANLELRADARAWSR